MHRCLKPEPKSDTRIVNFLQIFPGREWPFAKGCIYATAKKPERLSVRALGRRFSSGASTAIRPDAGPIHRFGKMRRLGAQASVQPRSQPTPDALPTLRQSSDCLHAAKTKRTAGALNPAASFGSVATFRRPPVPWRGYTTLRTRAIRVNDRAHAVRAWRQG